MSDLIKRDSALKGYDTVLSILDSAVNAVSEAKAIVLTYGSEPAWIPVKERLPEEDGVYLVSTQWGSGAGYSNIATYRDGKFLSAGNVKAWMNMPEPWSEE